MENHRDHNQPIEEQPIMMTISPKSPESERPETPKLDPETLNSDQNLAKMDGDFGGDDTETRLDEELQKGLTLEESRSADSENGSGSKADGVGKECADSEIGSGSKIEVVAEECADGEIGSGNKAEVVEDERVYSKNGSGNEIEIVGEEGKGENSGEAVGDEVNEVWENKEEVLGVVVNEEKSNTEFRHQYPIRPEAEDCSFYMKTGSCKFGLGCKFNHPVRRRGQNMKERGRQNEDSADALGQTECKFYLKSGGCKFGKACRYNHPKGNTSVDPNPELNFLGLPIRLGEKDCPYYMRTGSCKYGANCRFNHPDPTTVGSAEPAGIGSGNPVSLQGAPQPTIASWSAPGTFNETAPFMPMMFPPAPAVPSQNSDWNNYQVMYQPERSIHPPPAYVMNGPMYEGNVYPHQQQPQPQQFQTEEFPERPGQPECSYYLRTGDCKFKSNCKYHHPKSKLSIFGSCTLSDKGLPLRPGENVCTYYRRYGICKFGPACKYDHPINMSSNASNVASRSEPGKSTPEESDLVASGNRSEATKQ